MSPGSSVQRVRKSGKGLHKRPLLQLSRPVLHERWRYVARARVRERDAGRRWRAGMALERSQKVSMEKKALVVGRLIAAVEEYFEAFGKPMPMKALASRFAKTLGQLGGFPETLEGLRADGSLQIVMNEAGARAVFPAGSDQKLEGWRQIG